jgi:hypothetical protein
MQCGIRTVPAVVIDGKLAPYCASGDWDQQVCGRLSARRVEGTKRKEGQRTMEELSLGYWLAVRATACPAVSLERHPF